MKSYKAYLLGAAASCVCLVSGGAALAADGVGEPYVMADGTGTSDYDAALSSWKTDRQFTVDYSKAFLGLEHAYARGLSGKGLIIGVNDAGIHIDHPMFASDKITGYDSGLSAQYGNHGLVNPRRPWESHGTHVAGTIAADRQDGFHMFGTAFNAGILSATVNFVAGDFRWYGDYLAGNNPNTGFDNILGMAQTGQVRIINNSWGAANAIPYDAARDTVVGALTEDWGTYWDPVKENDVLLVWSAGNSSGAHAGYTTTVPMLDPTLRDHWLSVANYQVSGIASASSSLCGQTASWCVAAPGQQIVSGIKSIGLDSSAVISRFRTDSTYQGMLVATNVTALGVAAQNILFDGLNNYLIAQRQAANDGVAFDTEQWADDLAQQAANIAVLYAARTGNPDSDISTLAYLVYANSAVLGQAFVERFFVQADEHLQTLYGEYMVDRGHAMASYSGTSMAAPAISGFAGLLMEYFPEYNTGLISDILVSSSLDLDTPGVDLRSGWGAPHMGVALEGPTALRAVRDVQVLEGTRDVWTNDIGDARDRYDADVLEYNGGDIGGLVKIGGGELVLAGTVDYSGITRVAEGLLTVDGRIVRSALTVADGGTVGGIGELASLVAEAGGVVAPGSVELPYGTLSVAGDATFRTGSVFSVNSDVNGSQYSRLVVGGVATIEGGTVQVKANNGNWNRRTRGLRILTAGDLGATPSVVGTFDDLTTDLGFLKGRLTYETGAVLLTLERNDVSFTTAATTGNSRAVGKALDVMVMADTATDFALEDALLDGSVEAVAQALPQLTGEVHASLAAVAVGESRMMRQAMVSRGLGQAGVVQELDGRGLQAWASVVAGSGDASGGEYAAYDTSSSGFVAGIDKTLANGHFGVAVAQSSSDMDDHPFATTGALSSRSFGIYGGWHRGALAVRAGAAVSKIDIDTDRAVAFNAFSDRLRAEYEGDGSQIYGEVSWTVEAGQTALSPYAGLAHIEYEADFAEVGGDAALSGTVTQSAALMTLGVRSHTVLKRSGERPVVSLRGHLAWSADAGDGVVMTSAFADGPQFEGRAASIAGDALLADVSLDVEVAPRATVTVGYSGANGSDFSDNRLSARLSYRF